LASQETAIQGEITTAQQDDTNYTAEVAVLESAKTEYDTSSSLEVELTTET
jgi:hypothetical protein